MKICVLGAGVIGVSTAYMLGRMGHEVSVLDKGTKVASGASHANGAQLSYSHVDPFASPAVLAKLPAYLLGTDPGIRLGLSFNPSFIKWGLAFLGQCRTSRFNNNLSARSELAKLSKKTLELIEAELPAQIIKRTGKGKIVLAHSQSECDHMRPTAANRDDVDFIDRDECLQIEPALNNWASKFHGGLYAAGDFALDTVQYCEALKSSAEEKYGVKFHFGETIKRIEVQDKCVKWIETDTRQCACDATVVCLGNEVDHILQPLGLKTKIYPMQGYSMTLPALEKSTKISITDLRNKIVFANLGSEIRIAGFVDANQSKARAETRTHELLNVARQQWPGMADYDNPLEQWTHYRPMVPSGVPTIGSTKIDGLYLNIGHGSLGYTFAAGSATKIARAISHAEHKTELGMGIEKLWT